MSRAENPGGEGEKILTRERRSETTSGGASGPPPFLPPSPAAHFPILPPHVYASMRNASAYQRESEYVAIANGLARLDGPVINCVTHDYITDAADPLYYIQSYVRVRGRIARVTLRAARRVRAHVAVLAPKREGEGCNAYVPVTNRRHAGREWVQRYETDHRARSQSAPITMRAKKRAATCLPQRASR